MRNRFTQNWFTRNRATAFLVVTTLLLLAAGPAAAEELDLEKVRTIFEEGKKLNNRCVDTRL